MVRRAIVAGRDIFATTAIRASEDCYSARERRTATLVPSGRFQSGRAFLLIVDHGDAGSAETLPADVDAVAQRAAAARTSFDAMSFAYTAAQSAAVTPSAP
jgi:hypothetical protein